MTNERRRFFRIDDEAEISFKTISDKEYEAWGDGQKDEEGENLAKLEAELSMTLAHLKSQHPQLAKICELLNQKINFAMCSHSKTHGFIDNGELRPINLSACGIAFHTDQDIPKNENILLQLKLKPSNVAIVTTGKVVGAGITNGKNIVRIDFQDLGGINQDLLMQHLFQVQSRELKKQRNNN
ncbi:MAG: PilZ domain-containing protein [Oleispira antarctica]|nr:PilZ domain-containing protein [Oleispira antarctica]MBQ0793202.1 PilZ domain-containing protein [Oleispira antarctica]